MTSIESGTERANSDHPSPGGGRVTLRNVILVIALILVVSLSAGCAGLTGSEREDLHTVEVEGAESARVSVDMGVGQLWITGGSEDLLDARFLYNVDAWKPELSYSVRDGIGELRIAQPSVDRIGGFTNTVYEWDLRLGRDIPIQVLDVNLGVGTADLYMGDMLLDQLRLKLGVGDVSVDMTGPWQRNLDAFVEGGVGRCVLTLPDDVGIRVDVERGITHVDVRGLERRGDLYFNELYGTGGIDIDLKVRAGVGSIVIQAGQR